MYLRAAIALGLHHRPVAGLFGMTVTVALALNLVFLTHSFLGIPSWDGFELDRDRGAPEMIGFLFTAWAAGLAMFVAVSHRQAVLAAWSALFTVLLADDYFALHERMAKVLPTYDMVPVPYKQPVGEIAWFALAGAVLLVIIAVTYRYAAPEWRASSRVLTALLALLVACGVGIDAVHMLATSGGAWYVILTALEDGGELLLLAVMVTFLYGLAFCGHRPTPETLARRRTRTRSRGGRVRPAVRHIRHVRQARPIAQPLTPSGTGPPRR